MPGMRYLEVSRRYVSRWPDPAPDSACMPISLLGQTLLVSLGFARVSGFSMVVILISTANLYSLVHIYLRSILFTLALDF